jgi:hypothetical protein
MLSPAQPPPSMPPETPASATTHRLPLMLLLGSATMPLLLGLVAAKSLARLSQTVGGLSEEMFRGDRLPLLNIPTVDPTPGQSQD